MASLDPRIAAQHPHRTLAGRPKGDRLYHVYDRSPTDGAWDHVCDLRLPSLRDRGIPDIAFRLRWAIDTGRALDGVSAPRSGNCVAIRSNRTGRVLRVYRGTPEPGSDAAELTPLPSDLCAPRPARPVNLVWRPAAPDRAIPRALRQAVYAADMTLTLPTPQKPQKRPPPHTLKPE